MRTLLALLIGLAGYAVLSQPSEARDGCGPGYYFNGYRCRPMVREYYAPPPPPPRYYRGPYRTFNGCPPRYTIQDGVCKPYRGY